MDDGGKINSVIGCGKRYLCGIGPGVVRVYEVDEAPRLYAFDERIRLLDVKLVPAHVRDVHAFRNSADASAKQVEPAMQAKFFALRKEQVHAQANSQSRRS